MKELEKLLESILEQHKFIDAIVSNRKKKEEEAYRKIEIRPILLKNQIEYQFTYEYEKKQTHENLSKDKTIPKLIELMTKHFKQLQIFTQEADYQVLISKREKVTILKNKATKQEGTVTHNRKKNYILEEHEANAYLIKLGVMNEKGKVLANKYDKFRQINRFLELIRDLTPQLKKEEKINIIDFGCGKSYLTFALYDYLYNKLGYDIHMIGLDLKKDVVEHCNQLANELEYSRLKFLVGDIGQFEQTEKVNMVVTLHACDTATDAALHKAILWGAEVILSVPCCQHELLPQIHNPVMKSIEKHGIIKERMASLITDSLRANLLEIMGYQTQIIEFIDMEHTPKNILIRAFKTDKVSETAMEEYKALKAFWGFDSYLERALADQLK